MSACSRTIFFYVKAYICCHGNSCLKLSHSARKCMKYPTDPISKTFYFSKIRINAMDFVQQES